MGWGLLLAKNFDHLLLPNEDEEKLTELSTIN